MFNEISSKLNELLDEYDSITLPNYPNIGGSYIESDVSYAIISGERENKDINHTVNISVSSKFRETNPNGEAGGCPTSDIDQEPLYDLVEKIIKKVHKSKVENGRLFYFKAYEMFTPDSGKWRCLLTFTVLTEIPATYTDECLLRSMENATVNI